MHTHARAYKHTQTHAHTQMHTQYTRTSYTFLLYSKIIYYVIIIEGFTSFTMQGTSIINYYSVCKHIRPISTIILSFK